MNIYFLHHKATMLYITFIVATTILFFQCTYIYCILIYNSQYNIL